MKKLVIVLAGTNGAGKGMVAELLKKRGFSYCSLADEVRKEATTKGVKHTRKNLQDVGNELREQHGPAVLAIRVKACIALQHNEKIVVDSIRNSAELAELRTLSDFFFIVVDAPAQIRYTRLLKRDRTEDIKTYQDFLHFEAREHSDNPTGLQLHKVMEEADVVLINDGSLEELSEKLESVLRKRMML